MAGAPLHALRLQESSTKTPKNLRLVLRLHNSSQSNKLISHSKLTEEAPYARWSAKFFQSRYVNITDTEVTVSRHKKQIA